MGKNSSKQIVNGGRAPYKLKGFTLIELLAVIVILAIIAVIATPLIINVIDSSKVSGKISSVNMLLNAVNNTYLESKLNITNNVSLPATLEVSDKGDITINGLTVEYSGERPTGGTIVIDSEGIISAQNLTYSDGFTCTMGKGEKGCIQKKLVLPNMVDDPDIAGRKIFRGANPNNYINITEDGVKVKYRIVSIETDGTIKVIRNDNIKSMPFDSRTSDTLSGPRRNELNSYCNYGGTYYGCNAFMKVEGNYVNGSATGTVSEDSEIKKYLNEEYYAKLSDKVKSKIITHTYNMKGASYSSSTGKGTSITALNSTTNADLKWTGKIGLIEVRDFFLSTSNTETCKPDTLTGGYYLSGVTDPAQYPCSQNNYMFISKYFWTITPYASHRNSVFIVYSTGYVDNYRAYYSFGVRPVFYLSSNITLTGAGTSDSPFEIN